MKKISDYIKEFPEECRSKFLENTTTKKLSLVVPDKEIAFCCAFNWSKTPEGEDYWISMAIKLGIDYSSYIRIYNRYKEYLKR